MRRLSLLGYIQMGMAIGALALALLIVASDAPPRYIPAVIFVLLGLSGVIAIARFLGSQRPGK